VHDTFSKREYAKGGEVSMTVVECGPVRATLRIERGLRDSEMSVDVHLYRNTPRIDFVADVDWQERQAMAKIAFPVDVRSHNVTCEIQFGTVERPTHRNTGWDEVKFEICAHNWVDLSEGGYGVSLLNDGRYGHDVLGNVLRLTALRGPEYPDPEADRGMHRFAYALLPHEGDWRQAATPRRGWEFNAPMAAVVSSGSGRGDLAQVIRVEGEGLVVSALKPALDGHGAILRVYESQGGRGKAMVRSAIPLQGVVETNLVEEDQGVLACDGSAFEFDYTPYAIKTYRLVW
jgi:alpha-mannosidase